MAFKKGNTYGLRASKAYKLAVKHNLNTYRRMLSGSKVDGRTSLYRVLREKEHELTAALGGDPSPQERLSSPIPSRRCSLSARLTNSSCHWTAALSKAARWCRLWRIVRR